MYKYLEKDIPQAVVEVQGGAGGGVEVVAIVPVHIEARRNCCDMKDTLRSSYHLQVHQVTLNFPTIIFHKYF